MTAPETEEKMTTQTSKTLAVAVAALAVLAGCTTLEPFAGSCLGTQWLCGDGREQQPGECR